MSERVHLERAGSFVELEQRDVRIEHAYGRIGGVPKLRIETCSSIEDASDTFGAHMRRLERKGFRVGFHHPELEDAIVADSTDDSCRLVFADWLLEQRDPRGELIARMASGVDVRDHLEAFSYHLAPRWMASCELGWHLGFVRALTFRETSRLEASLLLRLFRHPSMMVVEELGLSGIRHADAASCREALRRRPPSLRRIDARGVTSLQVLASEIPGFET